MARTTFKVGDRVVITNEKRWSVGCSGVIKGVWMDIPGTPPYYLVDLDESPNPSVKSTYVYEKDLKAEVPQ